MQELVLDSTHKDGAASHAKTLLPSGPAGTAAVGPGNEQEPGNHRCQVSFPALLFAGCFVNDTGQRASPTPAALWRRLDLVCREFLMRQSTRRNYRRRDE